MRSFRVQQALALLAALALAACGEDTSNQPAVVPDPVIGMMEFAISHRTDGHEPSNAVRVEVTQNDVRLDGQLLLELERGGLVPAAERTDNGIAKLAEALGNTTGHSSAVVMVSGMVGYGTMARVIQTLRAANYDEIGLAVRPRSSGSPPSSPSWMVVTHPQIVAGGDTVVDPEAYGGATRPWSDFTDNWEGAYDACRAGQYVDCDGKPVNIADGGFLQVDLWARAQGMRIQFNRVGAPPPEPTTTSAHAVEMIEGVRAAPQPAEEEDPTVPATDATFTFRANEATDEESAISTLMQPTCGNAVCDAVIEGDETTPSMRILSLIGAAFPNGTTMPRLIFRLPS